MYCARCGQEGEWLEHCKSRRGDTEVYFGYNPGELCQGCYRDLVDDPVVFDTELRNFSFDFFYSASSGTSRAIVENQYEDNVLVSYATHMNGRIGTESRHFVDCGGDPQAFVTDRFVENNGYPTSHSEYLDYVEQVTQGSQDLWTLRDYPCAKAVLDKHDATISEFQRRTAEAHRKLIEGAKERDIKAQPVCVIQGQNISEYLRHINILKEYDVLTDYVCIGSIVPYGPKRQQQIILAIRSFLPSRFKIHGLGVNLATLREPGVLDALRSADTGYWMERGGAQATPWRWNTETKLNINKATMEYLDHKRSLNELLLDHDWDLDKPVKNSQSTAQTLDAFGSDNSSFSKNKPANPLNPTQHLDSDALKALERSNFKGMESNGNRTHPDQQKLEGDTNENTDEQHEENHNSTTPNETRETTQATL